MDMRSYIMGGTPTIQDWQDALELVKQDGVDDLIIVITKSEFNDGDGYGPELHDCFFVGSEGQKTINTHFHEMFLKVFDDWFRGRNDPYSEAPRIRSTRGDWDEGIAYWMYEKCNQTLDNDDHYVMHKISLKTLTYLGAIQENEHH